MTAYYDVVFFEQSDDVDAPTPATMIPQSKTANPLNTQWAGKPITTEGPH